MMGGAQRYLRDGSTVDDKLGGVADMLEGGMTASAPLALPALGRGLVTGAIPKLKTAVGMLAGAATVPAVRLAAPAIGLGPGASQLASDLAGFAVGAKAAKMTPGPKPRIPEYPEAPLYRITNPGKATGGKAINREGTGTYQKAVPEVVATDPMVKEAVSKWTEPQGSFTEYIAKEVGPKAQQRYWDTYDQMAEPYRDAVRTSGDDLANFLAKEVPQDKIRGDHSAYVQGLIDKYRGTQPSIRELETDLRSVNDYLKPFYAKSGAKQVAAARSDVADIGALEKLGGALREKIYTALDGTAGGELPAEAMRKYGAIKEFTDNIADLQSDALKGMTPSAAHRARQVAAGGAEAAAGFKHAAISRLLRAFGGGEDTIDRALMKAFAEYKGRPTPMPLGSPEEVPVGGLSGKLLGSGPTVTPPPTDASGPIPNVADPQRNPGYWTPRDTQRRLPSAPVVTPPPADTTNVRVTTGEPLRAPTSRQLPAGPTMMPPSADETQSGMVFDTVLVKDPTTGKLYYTSQPRYASPPRPTTLPSPERK